MRIAHKDSASTICRRRLAAASRSMVLFLSVLVLAGCSTSPMVTSSTETNPVQGAAIRGRVHGGQNPVSGASVYLYAVGTGGYGGNGIAASSSNASTSLLNSSVLSQTPAGGKDGSNNYYATTDSNGNFSISGDYTCPSANTQVYLYAVGGNPGLAPGTNNSAAGLLAGLGSCGSLSSSTFVTVNEISTAATARNLDCGLCHGRFARVEFWQHVGASGNRQRLRHDSEH